MKLLIFLLGVMIGMETMILLDKQTTIYKKGFEDGKQYIPSSMKRVDNYILQYVGYSRCMHRYMKGSKPYETIQ